MQKLILVLILADLLLLTNCGGGGANSTPSGGGTTGLQSIKIAPNSIGIAPGTNQAFTATGTYSDGSTKDLTLMVQWVSLGTNNAVISNVAPTQGVATALTPGTAVISATMGSVSNSAVLTVNNVLPTSLVLSPATTTIGWGDQQQYKATATFSDNSQQDVTDAASWTSSLPFVTASSGLVIGEAVGKNSVSALFGSHGATAKFTVDLSNLTSISVSPGNFTGADHTKVQLTALGTFADGSTRDVTSIVNWSSSNTTVANFTSPVLGLITCSSVGATTVMASATAPSGTISGSTTFNVTGATLNSIVVFPANATIAPGTKIAMTPIGIFSDSTIQDLSGLVTWSTNSSSTSVTATGIVTGISAGPSTITATSLAALGSIQGSAPVTTTSATLSLITLAPANTFITPGNTLNFTALGTFSDQTKEDVTLASTWGSNLSNIATVKAAVATGQGIGQAIITSKFASIPGTAKLTVAPPQQISIAITPSSAQIAQQTSVQLAAQGTLVGGAKQDLTTAMNWTSSSPSVATVGWQTGIVTGLTVGQSTITASLGSVSTTIQVTVTNASLTSITLSPSSPSVALGSSQQFTATGNFSDGTMEALVGATWTSSTPTVAVVDGNGLANTTGTGTTKITATVNGVEGSTNLTVQ